MLAKLSRRLPAELTFCERLKLSHLVWVGPPGSELIFESRKFAEVNPKTSSDGGGPEAGGTFREMPFHRTPFLFREAAGYVREELFSLVHFFCGAHRLGLATGRVLAGAASLVFSFSHKRF